MAALTDDGATADPAAAAADAVTTFRLHNKLFDIMSRENICC